MWKRVSKCLVGRCESMWKYALGVVGGVLVLALLSKWAFQTGKNYPQYILRHIHRLVQEAVRWHRVAKQDANPLIKVVHGTYAVCYMDVARNLVNDDDIVKITSGLQPRELAHEMQQQQAMAVRELAQSCPEVQLEDDKYGVHSGWL